VAPCKLITRKQSRNQWRKANDGKGERRTSKIGLWSAKVVPATLGQMFPVEYTRFAGLEALKRGPLLNFYGLAETHL
jgi:hypothetical protein